MAHSRLCSIPGCSKKHAGRGFCQGHLRRWQVYGDDFDRSPLEGRTPHAVAMALIELVFTSADPDACVFWPFGGGDYGTVHLPSSRTTAGVHRIVCERRHGPPENPKMEASHSCNNRRCFNPHHVRWDTPAGNLLDRWEHGTMTIGARHWATKLTPEGVRKARILFGAGLATNKELAEMNRVTASVMHSAITHKTWKWLD